MSLLLLATMLIIIIKRILLTTGHSEELALWERVLDIVRKSPTFLEIKVTGCNVGDQRLPVIHHKQSVLIKAFEIVTS